MQELSLDTQIRLIVNEIYDRRRLCAVLFAVISLSIVGVGLTWPKTYESSTTLIRDKSQVVRPLLEGTAVATSGVQQSDIAKEVIYSNKILDNVIERAGLNLKADGVPMDDRELQVLKSELRKKIQIDRGGGEILKISYTSRRPEEAFFVVSIVSELFIEETAQNKRADSDEAYRFIDSQVNEYKQKLDDITRRINAFKAKNVEIPVETMRGVTTRISELKDQIRRTSLELKEAGIQKESLMEQLETESLKSTAEEVVNAQQQRLAEMRAQLSTLRLSYTETYPDIVQLKEQIEALQRSIAEDQSTTAGAAAKAAPVRTELYARLKQQIADQELRIKTLEARKLDQERRLDQEISRSSQVNQIVARLEELSRDRDVNKQLYDQLLRRRENARVSLSLELEKAGALFKVQEPPIIPLVPKGLRYLHFMIASLVLGIGIPIGAIIAWLVTDTRIRHEDSLELDADIPVFGSIPVFHTPRERRGQKFVTAQTVLIVSLSLVAMISLSISRFFEMV